MHAKEFKEILRLHTQKKTTEATAQVKEIWAIWVGKSAEK